MAENELMDNDESIDEDVNEPVLLEDGRRSMHLAAAKGDVEEVKKLLNLGASADLPDYENTALQCAEDEVADSGECNNEKVNEPVLLEDGRQLLHLAAAKGDVEEIKKLLNLGASADLPDYENTALQCAEDEVADSGECNNEKVNEPVLLEDGRQSLHLAAAKGDVEEVKKLLNIGAFGNMPDYEGNTALHYAAREGLVDVVRVLIDNVSNLDIENDEYLTPLCLAVKFDRREVLKTLITKGANVNNSKINWCSQLLIALEGRDKDLVEVLFKSKVFVDIIEATQTGNQKLVKYVLEESLVEKSTMFLINVLEEKINEAFHCAIVAGQSELAKLFITYNVSLNKVNKSQNTPLLSALINDQLEIADELLKNGANIDDYDGLALRKLVKMSRADRVNFLLDKHVDFNFEDSMGMTPLHLAVANNSLEIVKLLVQKGADVKTYNCQGESPLFTAVINNQIEIVKLLLKNNAFLISTALLDLPLYLAVIQNHAEIVRLLIEKGANVNFKNPNGETLLSIAVENNSLPIVNSLLDAGATVAYKDQNDFGHPSLPSGFSLLHLAIWQRHVDVDLCKKLLSEGVPLDSTTNQGNTALMEAIRGLVNFTGKNSCKLKLIKLLIDYGANVRSTNNNGFQAINLAVKVPNHQLIEWLVEKGALKNINENLNIFLLLNDALKQKYTTLIIEILECKDLDLNTLVDDCGRSVLHLAAMHGNVDIMKACLSKGVNVNVVDIYGISALHEACKSTSLPTIEFLLDNGADVNMLNNFKYSPVHVAVECHGVLLCRPLISHKRFVDQPDPIHGRTVCHFLAKQGDLELMKLYLTTENRVNVNSQDVNGYTAFHIAVSCKYIEMSRLMSKYVTEPDTRTKLGLTPLMLAVNINLSEELWCSVNLYRYKVDWEIINRNIELAKLILELGSELDVQDDYGNTALHFAVWQNNVQMTKLLVEHGANMSLKNNSGCTVLHLSTQVTNLSLSKILLEKLNADRNVEIVSHQQLEDKSSENMVMKCNVINTVNNFCQTPLHLAIKADFDEMAQLLIDSEADLNIKDVNGFTPLMIATQRGNHSLIGKLFHSGAAVDVSNTTLTSTLLNDAIRCRSTLLIVHLLNGKIDIDMQDERGNTALHVAASQGWTINELFADALDKSVNLDVSNELGDTILYIKARARGFDVGFIDILLSKGANVNAKNTEGETALHIVAKHSKFAGYGHLLITHGANVNALDNRNKTPLHIALDLMNCHKKDYDIDLIKLLIENKADLNTVDGLGLTPLGIATRKCYYCRFCNKENNCSNCVNIVKLLLLNKARIDTEQDKTIEIFLKKALELNHLDLALAFIESDINTCCKNMILEFALKNNWSEIIESLLCQGVNYNKEFEWIDESFLRFALRSKNDKLIDLVLEKATNLDLSNYVGNELFSKISNYSKLLPKKGSPNSLDAYFLTKSLTLKQFGKALMLVDRGISLDVRDDDGCSPLHLAVKSGSLVLVNILLRKGVNVDLQNDEGQTALHTVFSCNTVDCYRFFPETCALYDYRYHGRLSYVKPVVHFHPDTCKILRTLIDSSASVDKADCQENTPLHISTSWNNLEATKLLIEKGASVHVQNGTGNTPLHWSSTWNNLDSIKLLIEKKASVHAQNYLGQTPLHLTTSVEVARVLIQQGASTNAQDKGGITPLHISVYFSLEISTLLINNNALIDVKDCIGETPLMKAVRSYSPEQADIVRLLIEKGSDCSNQSRYGSLLHSALYKDILPSDLLQYLLDNGAEVDNCICGCTALAKVASFRYTTYNAQYYVLFKHVLKLKLSGLPVKDDLKNIQETLCEPESKGYIDETFINSCLAELEEFKSIPVHEGFTVDKVLSNYQKPYYLLEEDKVEILDKLLQSPLLPECFPLYGYILKNVYKKSKRKRFYLLHLASLSMMKETRHLYCRLLDELVKYKIFEYLSVDDLQNFVKSE